MSSQTDASKLHAGKPPVCPTIASVLVVDDEVAVRTMLANMLSADGFQVVTAESGPAAIERSTRQRVDLVLTDLVLPGMDGIQTMTALKEIDPDIEVIVMTGYGTMESAVACLKHGAYDYIQKPLDLKELRRILGRALEKRRLHTALALHESSRALLGTLQHSELVEVAMEVAQCTMRADAVGLVLCPTGDGDLEIHRAGKAGRTLEPLLRALARRAMGDGGAFRFPSPEIPELPGPPPEHSFTSVLGHPLVVRDQALGALVVLRKAEKPPFTVFELRQGTLLATQVAMALDNARLFSELVRRVQELVATCDQLARAEGYARAIVETANEAIVVVDEQGTIRNFNSMAEKVFGWSRQEAIGEDFATFLIPERAREAHRENFAAWRAADSDEVSGRRMEARAMRRGGEEFPVEFSISMMETPEGKVMSAFIRDVTNR